MQCNLEQLHRYHDGELDGDASRDVETHLADCRECQKALEELQRLSSIVAMTIMPVVDPRRLTAISHAAWQSSNERGVRRLAGWITAAAAAVMLFAMVDFPSRQPGENGPLVQSTSITMVPFAGSDWEQAAVTPMGVASLNAEEGNRDLVQFAQWMVTDLRVGESSRQR